MKEAGASAPSWIYTTISCLIQVVGVLLVFFVMFVFIGARLAMTTSTIWACVITLAMSTIIWAAVLFKTPMYGWFFIEARPNTGVILSNQLLESKLPEKVEDRVEMYRIESLREIRAGVHGKLPWEESLKYAINMESELLIGNDLKNPLTVYTADNVELRVAWQVKLTPLPGFLCNLVRHSESQIEAFFKGHFERFLLSWFRSKLESEVFDEQSKKELDNAFENILDGPKKVHKDEKDYAVFSNTPQILTILRTEAWQKAMQSEAVLKKIGGGMKALTENMSPDMASRVDPNLALFIAGSVGGTISGEPIILVGLDGELGDKAQILGAINQLKKKGK